MEADVSEVGLGALDLEDRNLYFSGEGVGAWRTDAKTRQPEGEGGLGEEGDRQINKHTLRAEEWIVDVPDTNEDNYGSNCITISVGMTDKQVVWFMGFFSTSIFPQEDILLHSDHESA